MNKKNITLVVVVILIIGAIGFLEHKKPVIAPAQDIVLGNNATSTSGTSTAPAFVSDRSAIEARKALTFSRAKELADPAGFINTAPFKLSDLVGKKVILIDFWTYSCINCQRTIPYLNAWYDKYKDQGLEIIGIHTPEFDFEKVYDNVAKAVQEAGIKYPVVLDSNYGTWNAYQNQYWPHEMLIDIDGFISHDHVGEGDYDVTEKAIQDALKERDQALGLKDTIDTSIVNPTDVISMDPSKVESPETYFGSARNEFLRNGKQGTPGQQTLTLPSAMTGNELYLDGTWNFKDESAETVSPTSKIVFKYNAKNVYFVASSVDGAKIKVLRDGQPVGSNAGQDVGADSTATIKDNRLYNIIKGSDYGEHTLEIDVMSPGLEAFTFTFG